MGPIWDYVGWCGSSLIAFITKKTVYVFVYLAASSFSYERAEKFDY